MRRLNQSLLTFLVAWAILGTIAFLCYQYFPEMVQSGGKEIRVTVVPGRSYYILALAPGTEHLAESIGQGDVVFSWKETGRDAKSDLVLEKSSFKTRISSGGEVVKSGTSILKFVPKASGDLVISCKAEGQFTLAVWSGFASLLVSLTVTFILALVLTVFASRYWARRSMKLTAQKGASSAES